MITIIHDLNLSSANIQKLAKVFMEVKSFQQIAIRDSYFIFYILPLTFQKYKDYGL